MLISATIAGWLVGPLFGSICCAPFILLLTVMAMQVLKSDRSREEHPERGFPVIPKSESQNEKPPE